MIAIDDLYAAFRSTLNGDTVLNTLVPGDNWYQERHPQGASAAGPYGIILLTPGRVQNSSSFITKYYSLTLTVYGPASTADQSATSKAMADLLDFKPENVPFSTGGSINMISPQTVDQRVEQRMRSGTDVVPVISQWLMRVVETRA